MTRAKVYQWRWRGRRRRANVIDLSHCGPLCTDLHAGLKRYLTTETVGSTTLLKNGDGLRNDGPKLSRTKNQDINTTNRLEQDIAYLLDFQEIPDCIRINIDSVKDGHSVVYQLGNARAFASGDGAKEADNLSALLTADKSSDRNSGNQLYPRKAASAGIHSCRG